jgi:hypothetical protein
MRLRLSGHQRHLGEAPMDEHLPVECNFHVALLFDAIVPAARMKDFPGASCRFQKTVDDPHLNQNRPIHQHNSKMNIHPQAPHRSLNYSLGSLIVLAAVVAEGTFSVPVGSSVEPALLS